MYDTLTSDTIFSKILFSHLLLSNGINWTLDFEKLRASLILKKYSEFHKTKSKQCL